jgi:hypothetical protein
MKTFIHKILATMASQIRKPNVKLPNKSEMPHKITDDNQSIQHGVIHEKLDADLRSQSEFGRKRKRIRKS